jgi:hypothetical protein
MRQVGDAHVSRAGSGPTPPAVPYYSQGSRLRQVAAQQRNDRQNQASRRHAAVPPRQAACDTQNWLSRRLAGVPLK